MMADLLRKCAWCPVSREEHYYPILNRSSAGHPVCWLRQAREEVPNYDNVILRIAWLYTHVTPIMKEHHGVRTVGVSLLILEIMGEHTHRIWLETLEEFGTPLKVVWDDQLIHEITQYIKWRFAHHKYDERNKKTGIITLSWTYLASCLEQ